MKAVAWHGIGDIRIDAVPDPRIQEPADRLVRLTTSAVCGTDLRLVRGTFARMRVGTILGHEGVGAVEALGDLVRGFTVALRGELSKHPRIHIRDVHPTFVDMPGVDHTGNYTGVKRSLPPGSLTPETVTKAVVRIADHPRDRPEAGPVADPQSGGRRRPRTATEGLRHGRRYRVRRSRRDQRIGDATRIASSYRCPPLSAYGTTEIRGRY